jgi:chondroitin AC lyase
VIGEELVNSENLRGRYLADGAVFLYQTNSEYADIFPVWDWRRVPGVTCMTTGTTLAPAGKMATDFAGGVSGGNYGAEGVDYRRDGVSGRKGWFFLDEGVVCLGAGITGTDVRTSVDQRLAEGATYTQAGMLAPGVGPCKGVAWVLNGSEGYLFAQPADVWAGTQPQTGRWKNVYAAGSGTQITRDVFSIWIDHAAEPGSYAYTMIPGAGVEKLQAFVAKPPVEILSNTPHMQAIRDNTAGVTEALFYEAGELKAGSLSLSADGACAVILRAGAVYVADPTQKEAAVTLTINGKTVSVALPQGEMAGRTVGPTEE